MHWLIWKEYRVNRLILFVGLGLLLTPHWIAVVNGLYHPDKWGQYLVMSSFFSVVVTQIVFALLGGNAIAGERVDRSAEFLASLPFSRLQNLISKLILAPLAVMVIWGLNLPILYTTGRIGPARGEEMWHTLVIIIVTSLVFFCVGWLASSLFNSAVISICLGLIMPLIIVMGIQGVFWWLDIKDHHDLMHYWYTGICIALSLPSFIAGTWYYLRRVEP